MSDHGEWIKDEQRYEDGCKSDAGAHVSEVERVLRENGLTDAPGEFDSDIHSWRCSYPDIYGPCSCFQELAADIEVLIAERVRAARAEALREAADLLQITADPKHVPTWLRARADHIAQDAPESAATGPRSDAGAQGVAEGGRDVAGLFARNLRTVRHEAETPMRDHDEDGRCCLRAQLTPLDDE